MASNIHSETSEKPSLSAEVHKALEGGDKAGLEKCLQMWRNNEYAPLPIGDPPLVVFILANKYTRQEHALGSAGLQGPDAQILGRLLPVARELGFMVLLGDLTKTVEGMAEERCRYAYFKRQRCRDLYGISDSDDDEDEDEGPPEMGRIEEEHCKISHVARVDQVSDMQLKEFEVEEGGLVPPDAFENAAPDGQRYDRLGLMDSESFSNLEQWYKRSVLILGRSEDEAALKISSNGVDWTLEQLNSDLEAPSENTELIVAAIVKILCQGSRRSDETITRGQSPKERRLGLLKLATALRDRAIDWGRADLWNSVISHCPFDIDKVAPAMEAFELKAIKSGLSQLVEGSPSLKTRFAIIDTIGAKAGKGTTTWLNTLRKNAVSTYSAGRWKDVPTLLEVVKARGVVVLETSVLANITKTESYDFLVALAKGLQKTRTGHPTTTKKGRDALAKLVGVIRQCVVLAVPQWNPTKLTPCHSHVERVTRELQSEERMEELVNLFFAIDQPELCVDLHEAIAGDGELGNDKRFMFIKLLQAKLPDAVVEETKTNIRQIILSTLQAAAPNWKSGLSRRLPSSDTTGPTCETNRICEFVDLSCAIGNLSPCVILFNSILDGSKVSAEKVKSTFNSIFTPLVPQLKAILAKHGKGVTTEPFTSFFKLAISLHLSQILGPETPKTVSPVVPTRTAGCGACSECKQLSAFLNNRNASISFQAQGPTRSHLEREIAKAKIADLVTSRTDKYGRPHTLIVTKLAGPLAQLKWQEAKRAAEEFLRSIATGDELKQILGEQYNDAVWALQGKKVFADPGSWTVAGTPATSTSAGDPAGPGPAATSSGLVNTNAVAGAKRKRV